MSSTYDVLKPFIDSFKNKLQDNNDGFKNYEKEVGALVSWFDEKFHGYQEFLNNIGKIGSRKEDCDENFAFLNHKSIIYYYGGRNGYFTPIEYSLYEVINKDNAIYKSVCGKELYGQIKWFGETPHLTLYFPDFKDYKKFFSFW